MEGLILKTLPLFCYILYQVSGELMQDTRCFLENGATAIHFFVNENLKVGDTIGILGIVGDPSIYGDILLKLQELDSPVTFLPHSHNLTLVRPLDKEGIEGPASVYVNVICEKKHSVDPGYVIPVNIRVTDANDNAPKFINAPYILNISEVTVVGTRVLQGVRAIDADQPGPYSTVQYSILPSTYADYFIFISALEGTLILRKPLDYERLSNFSIEIKAQDQGNPPQFTTTTLYVNVIDADDQNPAFLNDQYKVDIPLHINTRKILRVEPAPIKAVDQDVGISAPVRYNIQSRILPFLTLKSETADLIMTRPLQDYELISPATIVIKATQIDNSDRYALTTVTVSREKRTDNHTEHDTAGVQLPIKFVLKDYYASIPENTSPGSVILTAGVNKLDPDIYFSLVGPKEDLDNFFITNLGELILKGSLDYERRIQHNFLVLVTDNHTNDTARVNISIEDVNEWEPRFRHPRYEFHARSLREGSIVGRLEAADGDRGDRVSLTLRGPDARLFEVRDNGELILHSIGKFNSTIARLIAIASDSGTPPRSTMVPVLVHLPNTEAKLTSSRATPVWLGSSVLLIGIFGAVLGLLGVTILILIFYIHKHKIPKRRESISSDEIGYREKSPAPSALNSSPQMIDTSILQDTLEVAGNELLGSNDIDNPVFGDDAENYNTTITSVVSNSMRSLYLKHKVAPAPEPPVLSATSTIPNVGGIMQNMNNLSARSNINSIETGSQNSSIFLEDTPDSLVPIWPEESICKRVKKLSWNDDDKILGCTEVTAVAQVNSGPTNEQLNLTVYF